MALLSLGAVILAACERLIKPMVVTTFTVTPTNTNTPEPTATKTQTPTTTDTATPTEIPCFRLLTPENGAILKTIGKVTFSWEAMPGAANYKLEIILPSSQPVMFETNNTSIDQYLKALRMGGGYHWQVTAFDTSGAIICSPEPFTFEKSEYLPPAPTQNGGGGPSEGGGAGTPGG